MMKSVKVGLILSLVCLFSGETSAQREAAGQDFNGGIRLGGQVTDNRNPWIWKAEGKRDIPVAGKGTENRDGSRHVPLPASPLLLGKTLRTSPSGREGLMPVIHIGTAAQGNVLTWIAPGTAQVTLPVNDGENKGTFTFRLKVIALLKSGAEGSVRYDGLYNDTDGNGFPARDYVAPADSMAAELSGMFAGDAPLWLDKHITVSGVTGVSRLTDSSLHQVDGVYGAQVVADSGQLRFLSGVFPSQWHVSLPVSIVYQ